MAQALGVSVLYRNIELKSDVALEQVGPTTAFLATDDPLPVGTQLELTSGDIKIAAAVIRIHESTSGSEHPAGMRVRATPLDDGGREFWSQIATGDDPTFPEPEPDGTVAAPVDKNDTDAVDTRAGGDRQTDVMDAVDIEAIEAASGAASGDEGAPSKKKRRRRARGKRKD